MLSRSVELDSVQDADWLGRIISQLKFCLNNWSVCANTHLFRLVLIIPMLHQKKYIYCESSAGDCRNLTFKVMFCMLLMFSIVRNSRFYSAWQIQRHPSFFFSAAASSSVLSTSALLCSFLPSLAQLLAVRQVTCVWNRTQGFFFMWKYKGSESLLSLLRNADFKAPQSAP